MTDYFAQQALLPTGLSHNVRISVTGQHIDAVRTDARSDGATVLSGLILPGFANGHSHAFHRAIRGRTHGDGGTFWTWRERMYAIASLLTPENYFRLARGVFGEMVLAGYTSVGEFHYVHHQPDGTPYAEANIMAEALRAAAAQAGIRLTLLDTCYLAGGIGVPLSPVQQRFSDGDAASWQHRVAALEEDENTVVGAAVHSVRAVPAEQLATVADSRGPLHVHLSEQPAENEQCQEFYGCTPTELLADKGILTPRLTAVHATHLTEADIALLGGNECTACFCPSTEADLADGIGPARELVDAGARLSLGTDQHVRIDPFEEAQRLEGGERLRTGSRGRFTPAELSLMATENGHRSLGWSAGRLEAGALADFIAIDDRSPRTAGADPAQLLLSASAADVSTVIVGGRVIVRDGEHLGLGDVGRTLHEEITALGQQIR